MSLLLLLINAPIGFPFISTVPLNGQSAWWARLFIQRCLSASFTVAGSHSSRGSLKSLPVYPTRPWCRGPQFCFGQFPVHAAAATIPVAGKPILSPLLGGTQFRPIWSLKSSGRRRVLLGFAGKGGWPFHFIMRTSCSFSMPYFLPTLFSLFHLLLLSAVY